MWRTQTSTYVASVPPSAGSQRRPNEGFVGRESVFEAAGFRCVARPGPDRVIMRLELNGAHDAA